MMTTFDRAAPRAMACAERRLRPRDAFRYDLEGVLTSSTASVRLFGAMEELWSSSDRTVWRAALDSVTERVQEFGKEGYPDLDSWFFEELPKRLASMAGEQSISGDDLVRIVEWKLKRGTWRPKLLDYAKSLSDAEVQSASRQAFKASQGIGEKDTAGYRDCCRAAMTVLTNLKGVGPATASAVLTAAEPQFPYMSDEAMDVSVKKQREYTVKRYVEFAAAVREKAKELSCEEEEWQPKDVERALHSQALLHIRPAAKRKRGGS